MMLISLSAPFVTLKQVMQMDGVLLWRSSLQSIPGNTNGILYALIDSDLYPQLTGLGWLEIISDSDDVQAGTPDSSPQMPLSF